MSGERLSASQRRAFARLEPTLEAKKAADAGRFMEARARTDALDARRAALLDELDQMQRELDATSLDDRRAYDAWRTAQRVRIQQIAAELEEAMAAEERRREVLTRSNGELEALKKLLAPKK